MIEQAVILAGGRGTRMEPFTDTAPKPMYPIAGVPFIDYLIRQVASFGIKRVLLLLGYLPDKIINYLGNGDRYGIDIQYDITPVEFDTGDRLYHAYNEIDDEFMLMYCDNYCPIDFKKLCDEHIRSHSSIQISVYANKDGYTKSNVSIAENGSVQVYDKTREKEGLQGVDIGYSIIDKKLLNVLSFHNGNFEKIVYADIASEGKMYATVTEHRYYSIGSWARIELTKEFFKNGRAVFLDRDGTLNERPPKACYVETPEQFVWLPKAKEAVKRLNEANITAILVSNQPGIARGNLTEDMLQKIHEKMQTELKNIGAHIDHIYYCPHNWDDGCDCRKPKPGMLYQAQKDLSLDLTRCWMVGDDDRDIEAGNAAGCKTIKVDNGCTVCDAVDRIIGEIS